MSGIKTERRRWGVAQEPAEAPSSAEASARGGKQEGMMREVEEHALGTTLSRDAGRAPSRPSGTAMISEQRAQRVRGTARGRLRLLTGAVLLSTIAGSAWTDNPVASGEWVPAVVRASLHWRAFRDFAASARSAKHQSLSLSLFLERAPFDPSSAEFLAVPPSRPRVLNSPPPMLIESPVCTRDHLLSQ